MDERDSCAAFKQLLNSMDLLEKEKRAGVGFERVIECQFYLQQARSRFFLVQERQDANAARVPGYITYQCELNSLSEQLSVSFSRIPLNLKVSDYDQQQILNSMYNKVAARDTLPNT